MSAIERHMIPKRKASSNRISISKTKTAKFGADHEKFMEAMYPEEAAKAFDHTPHPIFVEMDELHDNEW